MKINERFLVESANRANNIHSVLRGAVNERRNLKIHKRRNVVLCLYNMKDM